MPIDTFLLLANFIAAMGMIALGTALLLIIHGQPRLQPAFDFSQAWQRREPPISIVIVFNP